MKSLSLYIDKWFITVAINYDGNVIPLSLPNGEDRIWLYFHEDIANSRIEDLCAPEDETFPYKLACGVSSMEENRKIRDSALENLPHV